MNWPTGKQ